jgi:hypothetical protein
MEGLGMSLDDYIGTNDKKAPKSTRNYNNNNYNNGGG